MLFAFVYQLEKSISSRRQPSPIEISVPTRETESSVPSQVTESVPSQPMEDAVPVEIDFSVDSNQHRDNELSSQPSSVVFETREISPRPIRRRVPPDRWSENEWMDTREIITLPLAPIHKTKLSTFGYITISDVTGVNAESLSKDVGLGIEDAKRIIEIVNQVSSEPLKTRSLLDLLDYEDNQNSIVTFCEGLDGMLGGGVACGNLTEVCGLPGIGKTQFCFQLACDVQIPALFGGLEGQAVYIDTDGGFVAERMAEVATATVKHCQFIAASQGDKEVKSIASSMTVEKLLSGIHVYSCHDNHQLLATVNLLPEMLSQHKKVRLVVIDSITAHFLQTFEDFSLRTRLLTNLAQTLIRLAADHEIAILVTNKMTTKVRTGIQQQGESSSKLAPALGDSWAHACHTRIILEAWGTSKSALLYKSPSQPQIRVPFQITKDGFRDALGTEYSATMTTDPIPEADNVDPDQIDEESSIENKSAKRQRIT